MSNFFLGEQKYYINSLLADNLNSLAYNIKKDWDFVILVTGDRSVRTGKSVLALTIGAYLTSALNRMGIDSKWSTENVFFSSKLAISEALKMPKHSIIVYDEGREALASSKSFTDAQKDILDYFAECGQLNHIFIIVLPDYFNLVEEIAVARAEILVNVFRTEKRIEKDIFNDGVLRPVVKFERGSFGFYNRDQKKKLYDKAKAIRVKSYGLIRWNFPGDFINQYTIDENAYRNKKKEWLKRFQERKKEQIKVSPMDVFRDRIIMELNNENKNAREIKEYLIDKYKYEISDRWIQTIIKKKEKESKMIDMEEQEENCAGDTNKIGIVEPIEKSVSSGLGE
jgi:hypothetical protein